MLNWRRALNILNCQSIFITPFICRSGLQVWILQVQFCLFIGYSLSYGLITAFNNIETSIEYSMCCWLTLISYHYDWISIHLNGSYICCFLRRWIRRLIVMWDLPSFVETQWGSWNREGRHNKQKYLTSEKNATLYMLHLSSHIHRI